MRPIRRQTGSPDHMDNAELLASARNRLDTLEADPVTQTYVDGINTALDGRLDVLEVDPTTQTLLDAVQADVEVGAVVGISVLGVGVKLAELIGGGT